MPLGAEKAALLGAAGAGGEVNYWGDGSDGSLTTSGDVTHTVLNKDGSYDGDMFIAQYTDLDISSGDTMTVDQACRGLFIYVDGDCEIAGTLSMTARGGHSDPTASGGSDSNAVGSSGLQLGLFTSSGSDSITNDGTGFNGAGNAVRTAIANQDDLSSDGTIFTMSKLGGTSQADGATGAATISTGGGGKGNADYCTVAGDGGTGGAFSGGAGSGAIWWPSYACSGHYTHAGGNYGGAGSMGNHENGNLGKGGGAGNPGGADASGGGTNAGQTGVGGIIWLLVKGDLTITGSIVAKGMNGGATTSGGGGSGGGAIHIIYAGTLANSGTIDADGGLQGSTVSGNSGNGGIQLTQVKE